MRVFGLVPVAALTATFVLTTHPALAQARLRGADTVAIGASVGVLAPDNGSEESARALEDAAAAVDAFVEYHYDAHTSVRAMYGWARPALQTGDDRALRRQHVAVGVTYGWFLGRFRPFGSVGGGAYFVSRRESIGEVGNTVAKPGGLLGWGVEYALRTLMLRTEMNVHILTAEPQLPELGGHTLTAFAWTFGVTVPIR